MRRPRPTSLYPKREHVLLAKRRVLSILATHAIATSRTLEQKISDAGPATQRMEPHILTIARRELCDEGDVLTRTGNPPWYYLPETPTDVVRARYVAQAPIHKRVASKPVGKRIGQCLEIAVYRVLHELNWEFQGGFEDLDLSRKKRRTRLYSKVEPPAQLGRRFIGGKRRLDFMVRHEDVGWAGVEIKNVREWLYPNRGEIKDLLSKAVALDCVPVLIARRYPYVTFRVLSTCGVVVHQCYNQLFHKHDEDLALKAKDKRLLGYHDIRVGDESDDRLRRFIEVNLLDLLPGARERFDRFKDLLGEFGDGVIGYHEFAARVRRREAEVDEDADWDDEEN